MTHLFTDAQIQQALTEIPGTQPRSLWEKAHSIAVYLAFTGSYEAALTIWRYLFTELPRPDSLSEYHVVAPQAFCFFDQNKTEDFVGGNLPLEQRVWEMALIAREEITIDAWNVAPGYEIPPLANIRRARDLARPPYNRPYSKTELEALPYLDAFFVEPGIAAFAVEDAHLLYADILCRHSRQEEAINHLKIWAQMKQKETFGLIEWYAFAFPGLVGLIAQGHFEFLTALSREERSQIALKTVEAVRERLGQGTSSLSERTSISAAIFHSFFSLEPAQFVPEGESQEYFSGLEAAHKGSYPPEVRVSTPGETGSATFHLRFAEKMPDLKKGVFAMTFPFKATENPLRGELKGRVGNVFINSSVGEADDIGFEVPVGEYDVAAIFTRGVGDSEDEEVGLRHFEVDLCFLPKGTCPQFGEHFDRSWDDSKTED